MDCLHLVQQRQADIVPVDPEDMYCATKIPNQDFVVVQEYRTEEEPDGKGFFRSFIFWISSSLTETFLVLVGNSRSDVS